MEYTQQIWSAEWNPEIDWIELAREPLGSAVSTPGAAATRPYLAFLGVPEMDPNSGSPPGRIISKVNTTGFSLSPAV